jgi:subtilisin family serine protease
MSAFKRTLFVGWVALVGCAPALAQVETETHQGHEVVARTALVKFKREARAADIAELKRNSDVDRDEGIGGIGVRKIHSRTQNVTALLARFQGRPDVEYAEPDIIWHLTGTPNDPDFPLLWGMQKISAPSAWDVTVGSRSVVLGIVDVGIDYTHPDLAANVWSAPSAFTVTIGGTAISCGAGTHGYNVVAGSCDPLDDNDHGTHVSGTAGAAGSNAVGVAGVNWAASIMAIKVFTSTGFATTSWVVNGIEFAIQAKAVFGQQANVRVLSNSWGGLAGTFGGGAFSSTALRDEISRTNDNDMLFVAAAGNASNNNDATPFYPANFAVPNVLSVGASDSADNLASFSDYGTSVRIFAPGVDIWSTLRNGGYGYMFGTSMATPHVSGTAALVLSRCPFMNTSEVKSLLLQTADTVPGLNAGADGLRLNADRAVRNCITSFATSTTLIASSAQVRPGQGVTLTGAIAGRSASGTVSFFESGALIAAVPLANGSASVTTSGLSFGVHQFTATYSGDDHNVPSVSGSIPVMAGTFSSVALAASTLNISPGQTVNLTATVSGDSPTGTVTFLANGVAVGSSTATNGIAGLTTAPLSTGVYQFTASYGGDVNNSSSSSATAVVVTAKTTSSVALSSSATRVAPGQAATLTLAVSGQTPTGTVSVFDNGSLVGTAAVNAGAATFVTAGLDFGFHRFTASYGGDANNFPSSSAVPATVIAGNVEALITILNMLLLDD